MIERLNTLARTLGTLTDVIRTGGSTQDLVLSLREDRQQLREEALSLQEQLHAATQTEFKLKQKIEALQKTSHEVKNLEAIRLNNGTVVYVPRNCIEGDSVKGADKNRKKAPMYYCAQCAQNGAVTLLQFAETHFHSDRYTCQRCQNTALIPNDNERVMETGRRSELQESLQDYLKPR